MTSLSPYKEPYLKHILLSSFKQKYTKYLFLKHTFQVLLRTYPLPTTYLPLTYYLLTTYLSLTENIYNLRLGDAMAVFQNPRIRFSAL